MLSFGQQLTGLEVRSWCKVNISCADCYQKSRNSGDVTPIVYLKTRWRHRLWRHSGVHPATLGRLKPHWSVDMIGVLIKNNLQCTREYIYICHNINSLLTYSTSRFVHAWSVLKITGIFALQQNTAFYLLQPLKFPSNPQPPHLFMVSYIMSLSTRMLYSGFHNWGRRILIQK